MGLPFLFWGKELTTIDWFDPAAVALPDGLSTSAQDGLGSLLHALATDQAIAPLEDTRFYVAAYMLATVEHETWRKFTPVVEVGHGAGKPYGVPLTITCADGTCRQNTYYGRGYVQLTWQANYARLGIAMGLGRTLVENPDMAMQPATAYNILSYGMLHGTFTGRRLGLFLTTDKPDYFNARRVINGLDCADRIAALATAWQYRLNPAARATVA